MASKAGILIVDDDANLIINLQDILREQGYEIGTAQDGREAVQACKASPFDLALIDVRLPDINGLELCRELTRRFPDIECIVITGYASLESAVEAVRQERIVSYEVKPLNLEQLLFTIGLIMKRRRIERALRIVEERYRKIVETAEEGIWTVDTEAKTTFVNKKMAEMLGYSVGEMTGKPLSEFMDDGWFSEAEKYLKSRRKDVPEQHDIKFVRRDGSELWAIVSTNPIFDEDGSPAGALGMITDITERKQAEDELKRHRDLLERKTHELYEANRKLRNANDSISNELRAPLWRIDNLCQSLLLKNGGKLDEEAVIKLKDLRRHCKQTTDLINKIMRNSQISGANETSGG